MSQDFENVYPELDVPIRIMFAYMLCDLIGVVVYFNCFADDIGFVIHHVCAVVVLSSVLANPFGHDFALIGLLCEVTQPFINIKWYMDRFKMQGTTLYLINGALILVGWWIIRIGGYVFLLGWKFVTMQSGISAREIPIFICWIIAGILQIIWCYKITRMFVIVVSRMGAPKRNVEKWIQ